jgi:hypothetical protein
VYFWTLKQSIDQVIQRNLPITGVACQDGPAEELVLKSILSGRRMTSAPSTESTMPAPLSTVIFSMRSTPANSAAYTWFGKLRGGCREIKNF